MNSLFESPHNRHPSFLSNFTDYQRKNIKGHLVDTNNRSHRLFPVFLPTYLELSPGFRIMDIFSDRFSFNLCMKGKSDKICIYQLDSIVIEASFSQSIAIVALDASIKNNIVTFISHMHISNQSLIKTLHHAAFVTSIEAEMFTIKCSINQAISKTNISKIVIITDSIHVAKRIFDPSSHLFQNQSVAILGDLCYFFSKDPNNLIKFWEYPSCLNRYLHKAVDIETKAFNLTPAYSCKTSWDYSKKSECDDISNIWKMTFQALDGKEKQFLDLLDDNLNAIEPSYVKEGPWLQALEQSNSLCMCTMRAITNHTPIEEYRLRFFPREEFQCPCSMYPIKSRRHILHDCSRFNSYWNPRRDSLSYFVIFLKTNPNMFAFLNNTHTTSISRSYG